MVSHGVGPAGYPYHRFGDGSQRVVLLPGMTDPLGWNTPDRLTAALLARYYFRGFREFDVWVLSRPPGLPAEYTVREMAADYQDALSELGPASVVGFSLGGYVASHLAAECETVQNVVLVGCGTQLGEYGRQTLSRWETLAARRQYARLHQEYVGAVYAGTRRFLYGTLYRLAGRWLPEPKVTGDVELSCRLARTFDGADVYERVTIPTLLVGGRQDVLVPLEKQYEAADLLTDGSVALFDGGHAIYEERRRAMARTVREFLRSG